MPDNVHISLRNYLVLLGTCLGCALIALLLWLFNRNVGWMGMVIPLFIYFIIALVLLTSLIMWAIEVEDKDVQETCLPILRRYERTRSVDDLLYGYELWRLGSHGMATRIDFMRTLIDILVRDGYVFEAADLLNDYQMVATTPDSIRDYCRYRKVCERRMDALVAEAEERERRWDEERRAEEREREQRRKNAQLRQARGLSRAQGGRRR